MSFKALLGLIPILFIMHSLNAQSTGKVKFIITPSNSFYKINDQVYDYKEKKEVELPVGEHVVEFWSEFMEIHTEIITIEQGKTKSIRKVLTKKTDEYFAYQKRLNKRNAAKVVDYIGGISFVGFTSFSTIFMLTNNKYKEIEDYRLAGIRIKEEHETFALSNEEYTILETEFYTINDKYNKLRKQQNLKMGIGIPVVAVSYGVTIFYLAKTLKINREKPVYEEQNPFLGFLHNARPYYNFQSNQIGFTTSLNF